MAYNPHTNAGRPTVPVESPMLTGSSMENAGPQQDRGNPTTGWQRFFQGLADVIDFGPTIVDTFDNITAINTSTNIPVWPAGQFLGYLYYVPGRRIFYISRLITTGGVSLPTWVYGGGTHFGASLANIPTLGVNDAGYLFADLTLQHTYRWSGTAWAFAPDDDHMAGQMAPSAGGGTPLGGVWQKCDGTTVSVSKGDGTTVNIATPDLSASFIAGGSAQSGPNAAVAPSLSGSNTDDANTGLTNPANTGNTSPGLTSNNSTTQVVQSGTGVTVAGNPHVHTEATHLHSIGAPTDPGHHHGLSGVTVGTNGVPANYVLVWWMRR